MESRKLALRREKLEGDLGDDGLEHWNNRGLLAVLHWSLGLFWADVAGVVLVRQRRPEIDCKRGVEGLLPEEKKLNLAPNLGLGLGLGSLLCFCLSRSSLISPSLGTVVQKAFRQLVTILRTTLQLKGVIYLPYQSLSKVWGMVRAEKKDEGIILMKKRRTGLLSLQSESVLLPFSL